MFLIVSSFVVSFLLAAGAMAMLRGSADAPTPGSSTAVVVEKSNFPNVGPWRVTVAAVMAGRPSAVTVLRSSGVRNAPPAVAHEPRIDGDAARRLETEFQLAADGRRLGVLTRFLDTLGIGGGAAPKPSRDDARAVVTASSLLGGRIATCRVGSPIEPDDIRDLMLVEPALPGEKPAPQLTLARTQNGETVVSQARIKGGGDTRIAIAIVARARTAGAQGEAFGRAVVATTAKWLKENLRPPRPYTPKC